MSAQSTIEWTDATWNPVRGCTKISPGCAHCYAEVFAERFRGVEGHPYERGFDLRLVPDKLAEPFRWKKPSMIFVNSMSDLFHEGCVRRLHRRGSKSDVSSRLAHLSGSDETGGTAKEAPEWQIGVCAEQPHIWWGVSVENKRCGLPRVDHLRAAKAKLRFLPLNDSVLIGHHKPEGHRVGDRRRRKWSRARPMRKEWVVAIRDQCRKAKVPFFFKQWGGVRKALAGRRLDGRTYDEFPPRPSREFQPRRIFE